jgi:hypothetical protein
MTEGLPAAQIVGVVKPCEQYRFRVDLPASLGRTVRWEIRRRALQEITDCFLECTRVYQAMAWLGASNISFADSRHSPSDSKSEFLHMLICLKTIDLSLQHHLVNYANGAARFAVEIQTALPMGIRKGVTQLCKERGLELVLKPNTAAPLRGRVRVGGAYRSTQCGKPFELQPIKNVQILWAVVARRLSPLPWLMECVSILFRALILLLWPIPTAARVIFSFYYRAAAARILQRLNGPSNVFVYFDLRLGRNRDVGAYLRWKFGDTFTSGAGNETSTIPFTHIARPGHAYSIGAMIWAYRALKKMELDPSAGCVVVNYLMTAPRLLEVQFLRKGQRRTLRRELIELERAADDFFAEAMYGEFIASLDQNRGFPVEVSACYDTFFGALAPGVVVQADAIAKTARHFTACARRRGSRVIYVADRICTSLRTSNQLIRDEGDNPHLPDRCVVFDRVSGDEFVRQGMPTEDIYSYYRNFATQPVSPSGIHHPGPRQVVILLQAYEDNIGGMVHLGEEIARNHPELTVLFQEHPNFRVSPRVASRLMRKFPGKLRFLETGGTVDFTDTLALITGYSTAAVPGVLAGVPLIWLRRQIDNSIFGEAYLDRIGFAADKYDDVSSILKRLIRLDPATLEAAAVATTEAVKIFMPDHEHPTRSLTDAIAQALKDSFAELSDIGSQCRHRQPCTHLTGHHILRFS